MKKLLMLLISVALAGSLSAQATQKDKEQLRKDLEKERAAKHEVAKSIARGDAKSAKKHTQTVKARKRAVRNDVDKIKRKDEAAARARARAAHHQ